MTEWFKVPVLKTGVGQLTVGSNPSLSAQSKKSLRQGLFLLLFYYFFGGRITGVPICIA